MTQLSVNSKAYLLTLCGLSKLTTLNETTEQITFKVEQAAFLTAFSVMQKKYGQFKAYPVDTHPGVSQIDAVWEMAPEQNVIFITELTDSDPNFYVALLNAPYTPGMAARQLEKARQGFDKLTQTSEWHNLGQNLTTVMSDAKAVELAAQRLGLV